MHVEDKFVDLPLEFLEKSTDITTCRGPHKKNDDQVWTHWSSLIIFIRQVKERDVDDLAAYATGATTTLSRIGRGSSN